MRLESALALRASAILLTFEKFTRAYLFQIALEIMWLPIQIISIPKYKNRKLYRHNVKDIVNESKFRHTELFLVSFVFQYALLSFPLAREIACSAINEHIVVL